MRRKDERATQGDTYLQAGFEVGYLYANLKVQLNAIAAKAGDRVPALGLAVRLGNLLLAETGGELLHHPERVPQVRRRAARGHAEPAPAAKVHVRPRDKRSLAGKKRTSAGVKAYWASMSKSQRQGEMQRRRRVAAERRAA